MKKTQDRKTRNVFIIVLAVWFLFRTIPWIIEVVHSAYDSNGFEIYATTGSWTSGNPIIDLFIAVSIISLLEGSAISFLATTSMDLFRKKRISYLRWGCSAASIAYLGFLLIQDDETEIENLSNQASHTMSANARLFHDDPMKINLSRLGTPTEAAIVWI